MAKKISTMENDWIAEEDATTLARYQEIISDKKRLSNAMSKAKEKIKDWQSRANALNKSLTGLKNK